MQRGLHTLNSYCTVYWFPLLILVAQCTQGRQALTLQVRKKSLWQGREEHKSLRWAPQVSWSNSPWSSSALLYHGGTTNQALMVSPGTEFPISPSSHQLWGFQGPSRAHRKQILLPSSEVSSLLWCPISSWELSKGMATSSFPPSHPQKPGTKRYNGIYLVICTAEEK